MNNDAIHEAVVVGAGFSGIGAAIKLGDAGISNYLVLEEGDGVGGAWHWNTYPGIGVDIPSFSYQFSFEKRSDWSRVYATGKELKAYAEECVDKYGVRPRLRLNTRVTARSAPASGGCWSGFPAPSSRHGCSASCSSSSTSRWLRTTTAWSRSRIAERRLGAPSCVSR